MLLKGYLWKSNRQWVAEIPIIFGSFPGMPDEPMDSLIKNLPKAIAKTCLQKKFTGKILDFDGVNFYFEVKDLTLFLPLVIKRTREKMKLSLADITQKLGYSSRNSYTQYESGKTKLTIAKYCELMSALDPSFQLIFDRKLPRDNQITDENKICHELHVKSNSIDVWKHLTETVYIEKWWAKNIVIEAFQGGRFLEPWTDDHGNKQLASGFVSNAIANHYLKFSWKEKFWKESETTCVTFRIEQTSPTMCDIFFCHEGWLSFSDKQRKIFYQGFSEAWGPLLQNLKKALES